MNFRKILTFSFSKPQPRRSLRNRQPVSAEFLEVRTLMTGKVTALLSGGTLTIAGDAKDNQVEITQPTPGTIRVEGLDGTKINGNDFAEISGIRHVTLRLTQGGTDQVAMQGPIKITGNLRATLGAGDFLIEGSAGLIEIGRDLNVVAGPLGNVTLVNEVTVRGSTNIRTGGDTVAAAGLATLPNFGAARFSDSLTIDNPYFPLVAGTVYTYAADGIDDVTGNPFTETNTVEVLDETKTILGIETRVVHDRVYKDGLLIEDTFDWYAQDDNGNVWYLGEDVTDFDYDAAGNLIGTSHPGTWEAGVDNAVAGTIMRADPHVGDIYYQEFQPGGVVDQAKVLARDETLTGPLGTFTAVLRTQDDSVRAPFDLAHKVYAPGIGIIGEFKFDIETNEITKTVRLVSVELNGLPVTELVSPDGFSGINPTGRATGGATFAKSVRITAGGAILLKGAELRGEAQLSSGAETFVIDSEFSRKSSITAVEAVTFRDVIAHTRVSIRTDNDVHVFHSDFDDLRIVFGAGENLLVVEDSSFGNLTADGGRGDNTFESLGRNKFGNLTLKRF